MAMKKNKKRFDPRYFMSERTDSPEAVEEVVETTTEPMEEQEIESVQVEGIENVTPENLELVAQALMKMATDPSYIPLLAGALATFGWSLAKGPKDSDQPK